MEDLRITESIRENLLSAAKWLKILAVMGTAGMVLMIIFGIALMLIQGLESEEGTVVAIIYFVICAIYFYPLKKSFEIVSNTRKALNDGSQDSLEISAKSLRSLLGYITILSVICIVFYALVFIIAILAGYLSVMID